MSVQKKLICIGIIYTDNAFDVTPSNCKSLANAIKDFYETNSRGLVHFNVSSSVVKVPYPAKPANVNKAEQFAISKCPGFDLYAIVLNCISTPHAGGKIAHLKTFLKRDGQHETGHLLDLEHAGSYDNKFVLDSYGDALSVMGRFPSSFLTAPQYQFKKWVPEEEIATYTSGSQTFTLKRVIDFTSPGLSMVMIVPKEGRSSFISFPQGNKYYGSKPYLALHLQNGGGSQKVKTFTTEFYDTHFTGLHIKILLTGPNTITFTVDYNSQISSSYVLETDPTPDELDEI